MGQLPSSPRRMIQSLQCTQEAATDKNENELSTDGKIRQLVDHGKVDMRRVTISLWEHKQDSAFITALCVELSKLIDAKPVLDQVEFYLPQLAHMIIHLDNELPMSAIQQFVLIVAHNSVHFAMQFFWIVYAALDENRPKRNGDNKIFMRCTQLLLTLEQCIVYGSPDISNSPKKVTIPSLEMEQILMADRRYNAMQSTGQGGRSEGWLMKKGGGTRRMGRRSWNQRWCKIERRILFVYTRESDIHARSVVPLDQAEVHVMENAKHPFYFEIFHNYSKRKYKFSALSEEELNTWVKDIREEAVAPVPPLLSPKLVGTAKNIANMSEDMRRFVLEWDGETSPQRKSHVQAMLGEDKQEHAFSRAKSDMSIFSSDTDADSDTDPKSASPSKVLSPRVVSFGNLSIDTSASESKNKGPAGRSWLDPGEQKRYDFFSQQRTFIKSITDMCEDLRSVEIPQRKQALASMLENLKIPDLCFLPLCKSTDVFQRVLNPCCEESHVFTTNERVPCLMYFETVEDEERDDVSCALYKALYQGANIMYSPKRRAPPIPSDGDTSSNATDTVDSSIFAASLQDELLEDENRKAHISAVFGEIWVERKERIQSASLGNTKGWNLGCFIGKSNDDLRQEVFVMQLISYFDDIFQAANLPLVLKPYRIMSTGGSTGLLEVVKNATSLDGLKKSTGFVSLRHHFESLYGEPDSDLFLRAQKNFIHSLAAYSIVCHVLAIKDRHNGNILLDIDGKIIHIDFGFLFGKAPGGSFSMETAPFKLTSEMVDVIGGRDSANFKYFISICVDGAKVIRQHTDTIMTMIEVMSYKSKFPCFQGNLAHIMASTKDRLFANVPEAKIAASVESMIDKAYNHFGTKKYDQFQVYSNGIAQ